MKIIKFEKDGCMLCKRMDKILSDIGASYEVINLDEVDNAQELINKYNIKVTPTLVKLSEDKSQSLSGFHTLKEIEEFCGCSSSNVNESALKGFHCENGMCGV